MLHHLAGSACRTLEQFAFCSSATQSEGHAGASCCDGVKQIKIQGQMVPVAARIERIDWMSAHADADRNHAMAVGVLARPRHDLSGPR